VLYSNKHQDILEEFSHAYADDFAQSVSLVHIITAAIEGFLLNL
jgi:hypothetical protein